MRADAFAGTLLAMEFVLAALSMGADFVGSDKRRHPD
jgi:hypothetical protein